MIDIEDPTALEALFLRLEARRIVRARWWAGEPPPEGATAILGKYTPDRQAADSEALKRWCEKRGLEFMVYDRETGEHFATKPQPADATGHTPQAALVARLPGNPPGTRDCVIRQTGNP